MRAHGMYASSGGSRIMTIKTKLDCNDVAAKANKKRKLIEDEGISTVVDDDECFECLPEGNVVKFERGVKEEVHTNSVALSDFAKIGWQGDAELLQLYDVPEKKIKEKIAKEFGDVGDVDGSLGGSIVAAPAKIGWYGDEELLQLYDVPKKRIKEKILKKEFDDVDDVDGSFGGSIVAASAKIGWYGDEELSQLYDVPEKQIKEESIKKEVENVDGSFGGSIAASQGCVTIQTRWIGLPRRTTL